MIGVAQDDLRLHLITHIAKMAGLHRARRAYRHEDRGLYRAVVGMQDTGTGVALRVVGDNIEIHRLIFAQKYDFFPNIFLIFANTKIQSPCNSVSIITVLVSSF